MIAAQSIDGFISRHQESGTDFCSKQDAAFLASSLKAFDSMVMGRKTYETLRDRILASTSAQYLRKIQTKTPALFSEDRREGTIEFTADPPATICRKLAARGRTRCALLGGGETYGAFLKADLVDELWLTIEPVIFGAGVSLASEALDNRFRLLSTESLANDTLLLKYEKDS